MTGIKADRAKLVASTVRRWNYLVVYALVFCVVAFVLLNYKSTSFMPLPVSARAPVPGNIHTSTAPVPRNIHTSTAPVPRNIHTSTAPVPRNKATVPLNIIQNSSTPLTPSRHSSNNTVPSRAVKTTTTKVKPKRSVRCFPGKAPLAQHEAYREPHPPDVTVVTAYFNLGRFRKAGSFFHTQLYMGWAKVYRYLRNPLVFYTDSEEIEEIFKTLRANVMNLTSIIRVDRKNVWAFNYVEKIRKIYSTPGYPKHHPNTVVPEYTCAQHAKYALVEESIKNNYFNSSYFTWIDLGYFRNIVKRQKEFVIVKPRAFNDSYVAMNKVYNVKMNVKVETIFKANLVWIGGGMFFGSKTVLPTFIADYRAAIERYLNMSLSDTDQQVLYAMHTDQERGVVRQRVALQLYVADVSGDCWFYLGYSCYRELARGSVPS